MRGRGERERRRGVGTEGERKTHIINCYSVIKRNGLDVKMNEGKNVIC